MVGLGSADNTTDAAKPISTSQQTALDLKAPLASPAFTGTVKLDNLIINKSTWVQLGLNINGDGLLSISEQSGWSISLSSDGKIIAIGAPYNDINGTNSGTVRIYKWNESIWNQQGSNINGEVSLDNAGICVSLSADGTIVAIGATGNDNNGSNSGNVRVYKITSATVTGITPAMVGLENVNNTSDMNKPVSTAQQTALDLKVPLPMIVGSSPTSASGTIGQIVVHNEILYMCIKSYVNSESGAVWCVIYIDSFIR